MIRVGDVYGLSFLKLPQRMSKYRELQNNKTFVKIYRRI